MTEPVSSNIKVEATDMFEAQMETPLIKNTNDKKTYDYESMVTEHKRKRANEDHSNEIPYKKFKLEEIPPECQDQVDVKDRPDVIRVRNLLERIVKSIPPYMNKPFEILPEIFDSFIEKKARQEESYRLC